MYKYVLYMYIHTVPYKTEVYNKMCCCLLLFVVAWDRNIFLSFKSMFMLVHWPTYIPIPCMYVHTCTDICTFWHIIQDLRKDYRVWSLEEKGKQKTVSSDENCLLLSHSCSSFSSTSHLFTLLEIYNLNNNNPSSLSLLPLNERPTLKLYDLILK